MIAEQYDDLYDFWYDPLAQLTIPLLDLNSSDEIRLADIGGGTGGLAESIYKLSGNKITYHTSHHYSIMLFDCTIIIFIIFIIG